MPLQYTDTEEFSRIEEDRKSRITIRFCFESKPSVEKSSQRYVSINWLIS